MNNQDNVQFLEEELLGQLQELKEEAQKNLAGWQRAQADLENFKKRQELQQKDLLEFAKEVTIVKILPTLDGLEQGLKQVPMLDSPDFAIKYQQWQTGIDAVLQNLAKVLNELGVKKIIAVGKSFDPHFHEAIREIDGADYQDGVIVDELQVGYELNNKVIRPSQVIIGKNNFNKEV